jgi:cysteinyl-tRNA synthetase
LESLKSYLPDFVRNVLGLADESEKSGSGGEDLVPRLMELIINLRNEARFRKDFQTSDTIRDALKEIGIQLKDGKEGTGWEKLL